MKHRSAQAEDFTHWVAAHHAHSNHRGDAIREIRTALDVKMGSAHPDEKVREEYEALRRDWRASRSEKWHLGTPQEVWLTDNRQGTLQALYFHGWPLAWEVRLDALCVHLPCQDYQVDLERDCLEEWLVHIARKTWATNRVIADLALAWAWVAATDPKVRSLLHDGRTENNVFAI